MVATLELTTDLRPAVCSAVSLPGNWTAQYYVRLRCCVGRCISVVCDTEQYSWLYHNKIAKNIPAPLLLSAPKSNCCEASDCSREVTDCLKPTGYVIHQQFNIQQLYVLPTLCLCVLYLSENKQRFVPLTA